MEVGEYLTKFCRKLADLFSKIIVKYVNFFHESVLGQNLLTVGEYVTKF